MRWQYHGVIFLNRGKMMTETVRLLPDYSADDPLCDIAERLADPLVRSCHYKSLTARRDEIEPVVNAFEIRRESCPNDVKAPLNGLPISVKDQIATAGWPRSFGLERPAQRPDPASASVVQRLQGLGAVVTGKTALPPFAMDFQTFNERRGPTHNPHNPSFTSGGSTGGGAAAVASGMSNLDIGADLSGSLRIPAAWCGVSSYTPTEGLWPNDGLLNRTTTLDHFARIGLTARTSADLGFIWHVLEKHAEAVSTSEHTAKIAIWSPAQQPPCDEDTFACWTAFKAHLSGGNMALETKEMITLFDEGVYEMAGEIIGYETGGLIPWPIRWMMRRDRRASTSSPGFIAHIHEGYRRHVQRYADNLVRLAAFRENLALTWVDVDALLLPVTGICAFKHILPAREKAGGRTYDTVFDTLAGPLPYYDALTRFTLPVTALGWPVVTLPIGRDSNGLPVGAQLVGKPGRDAKLLALAEQIEALLR
ncbi:amidase [Tateyamaria omphalii]|uniref:amidase n=1 Tax=Tateyamaria omphalii TaxID=299262 RepID=UPI001C99363A|nr:amidase [Tateyamaria omphalii]MBY5935133.1 amidase [Tateyamaria omphalii]